MRGSMFTALAVALLLPCVIAAQSITGKIEGVVKDKASGRPIPGAAVVVKGTARGASTGADGYYFILNMQPGTYTLVASMIGYRTVNKEGVQVIVDQTTRVNFELEETVLDGEEVVVTAERPLIERDVTSKVSTVTYEDIKNLPAEDMTRVLALQSNITILTDTPYSKSGYDLRGIEDIRMRGGRNNELALVIDGMKVGNPLFGGFGTRVNNNAINQMTVAAGGFSPEYGNALSGVINLSTREGGSTFSGQLEYSTSMPFGLKALAPAEGRARNYQDVVASFSGPVPFIKNMSFFFSGEANAQAGTVLKFDDIIWDDYRGNLPSSKELFKDFFEDGKMDLITVSQLQRVKTKGPVYGAVRWINPIDIYKGWKGMGWDNSFDYLGKLTWRLSPNIKLAVSLSQSGRYSQANVFHAGYYYYLPDDWFGGWYNVDRNPVDKRETIDRLLVCSDCGARVFLRGAKYDDGRFIAPGDPTPEVCPVCGSSNFEIWHRNRSGMGARQVRIQRSNRQSLVLSHTLSPSTFYTFRFQRFFQSRRSRILNDYSHPYGTLLGVTNYWGPDWDNILAKEQYAHYNTYGVLDPWEGYFAIRYDNHYFEGDSSLTYDLRLDFTSQVTRHHQLKFGGQFVYMDVHRHDDQGTSGPSVYPTIYRMFPKEGALYILDKIEYGSVVINVGGRMDYANAGGEMWADPLDPLREQDPTRPGFEYTGWVKAKKKFKFSPRIGMAYPLTDKSVVHFNFGHFYQSPNYRDLYRASGAIREVSMMRGNIIGNPSLEPEKAIQYEIGFQQQIGDLYGLNVTLWTKETTNQVGSITVPAYSDPGHDNPYTYYVFLNNNFGSAKGVDVTLRKRYSNYFSGTVNYTWSRAMVLKPTSWDGYWDEDTKQTMPKRESVASWDQPHSIRVHVDFSIPSRSGPRIFGKRLLSNLGVSLVYFGESGRVYTPYMGDEGYLEKENSARWPFWHQFDLRAYKNVKAFGLTYSFFVQVRNLFDRLNVLEGYARTGSATDPGGAYGTYSATRMDGITINNFGPRRSINFGVRVMM
ncbi:MAG: TonB-dependent receptor [Candidatus Oleimicrobiaceae bacterium]